MGQHVMKANLAEAHNQLIKAIRMAQRAVNALDDAASAAGAALQGDQLMIAAAASDFARTKVASAAFEIKKELDQHLTSTKIKPGS